VVEVQRGGEFGQPRGKESPWRESFFCFYVLGAFKAGGYVAFLNIKIWNRELLVTKCIRNVPP